MKKLFISLAIALAMSMATPQTMQAEAQTDEPRITDIVITHETKYGDHGETITIETTTYYYEDGTVKSVYTQHIDYPKEPHPSEC